MNYEVEVRGKKYQVELNRREQQWECRVNGEPVPLDALFTADGALSLLLNGRSYELHAEERDGVREVQLHGERFAAVVRDPRALKARRGAAAEGAGPKKILAPMPGKIVRIIAAEGTEVEAGKGVIVVEAMKMQNELKAPKTGVVKKILVGEGSAVNAGDPLVIIE